MRETEARPRRRQSSSVDDVDRAVLVRIADGELDALEDLYDRYKTMAYSIAYRITADASLAEDVVQDAFLGAWRNAARYAEARGSVKTWLLAIVHHRAIDALRRSFVHEKRRASDEGLEETLETRERTDVEAARHEEAATVRAALAHLPSEQSQVIELAYFGGFTHSEIAEMLETPIGTVKGRMRLGLEKMRRGLGAGQVSLG